jgi:diguanylate cyclase (GGDEF)-like protein
MHNEWTIQAGQPATAKWLSGADELLGWLSRHQDRQTPSGQATAIQLLRQAEKSLRAAQERISEQEERIRLLETLATTDELTGLANRRGFFEMFHKELDRAGRGQSEGGLLILIDLDNFKAINDTYGHQAGDAALKLVAATLSADIRLMDTAARLGGDEFVLLLANTDRTKAAARARDLVRRLNALSLVWMGVEIPVRASLGLRDYKGGDTAERIFGDADAAMYETKLGNKLMDQEAVAAVR